MQTIHELLGDLEGQTLELRIDDQLGGTWCHEPGHDTQIRFYADTDFVKDTVIEYYQDYLEDKGFFDDEMKWSHPTIAPFATVGGESGDDDESFFSDSFAFLFWDSKAQKVLSATSDDWDFEPLSWEQIAAALQDQLPV